MKRKYIALLLSLAGTYMSCTKEKEFVINKELNPDDIIKITSIVPASAYADSNSNMIIRVQINSNTDSASSITLTTTSGLLNAKTRSEVMRVNVNRYADFILTSGRTSGLVSLRASVLNTYFRDTILNFIKSYPDTILVYPEAYNIAKNSSVAASIQLIKNIGFPSLNQTIILSALDSDEKNVGNFSYNEVYVPGTPISVSFIPPVDYIGKITLQANVIKENGDKILGQNTIIVH